MINRSTSAFTTTAQVNTQITNATSAFTTTAQVNTQITNAISGKQDSITVTANSSYRRFPLWNANGQITAYTGNDVYTVSQTINGSSNAGILRNNSSTALPTIYAPTSAGTSGNILKSNGSGAPSWVTPSSLGLVSGNGVTTITVMDQATYDGLTTKNANTFYIITGTT